MTLCYVTKVTHIHTVRQWQHFQQDVAACWCKNHLVAALVGCNAESQRKPTKIYQVWFVRINYVKLLLWSRTWELKICEWVRFWASKLQPRSSGDADWTTTKRCCGLREKREPLSPRASDTIQFSQPLHWSVSRRVAPLRLTQVSPR